MVDDRCCRMDNGLLTLNDGVKSDGWQIDRGWIVEVVARNGVMAT